MIFRCKDCKKISLPILASKNNKEFASLDQFKEVVKEYKTYDAKTDSVQEKSTKLTERVSEQKQWTEIYNELAKIKKKYLKHKYGVYNDKYHWPLILSTIPEYGFIVHR